MPLDERRERHSALLQDTIENDVNKWQKDFLDALRNEDLTAAETRSVTQMSIDALPEPVESTIPGL